MALYSNGQPSPTSNIAQRDGGRDIGQFDPESFARNDLALDYGIEHAKKLKDWPALVKAVDAKIEEQRKFIAWRAACIQGVGQPKKNGPGTGTILSDAKIAEITGIRKQQAERMRSKLADPGQYRAYLLGSGYMAAFLEPAKNVRGTQGTGKNEEWFTPPKYIKLARAVLNEIDLDPATHEDAQTIVQAARYFTKKDDGLKHEWYGNVWLNPPYGKRLIAKFIAKLRDEWDAGRISEAICLTHNYTDTIWFQQKLVPVARAICFTQGRIKFQGDYIPDPTQGQAFTYLGNNSDLFIEVFTEIGFVAREIIPRRKPSALPRRAP